ncbi:MULTISPECIES: hypothetical protein [Nitrosomonas]|uniref:Uncharacterized protein n=1 Tax=Nitrosomonas communis TaxID=44574 RepID=A0A0F7KH43_9PROT|nr:MULTISPECIES: hypothetical protein [Nitrosomonas]AKH38418.1 hypothetical protein AAW31_12390 [Nitrosomonas communis]TYP78287.1 hypothetical protein BCL69_10785 [Nitrosomonas communis]UVS60430.1 hypothetical protein NX761_13045 [Nitrosomonas sp. PLL12]
MDIINMVFSFLIGTAVGVIIAHSWRAHVVSQAVTKIKNIFDRLWHQHPKLLQEMKQDMDNPDYKFQREFYILNKKQRLNLNLPKPCLAYFKEEHDGLQDQLKTLEDYGFVSKVTESNKNNFTKYQFSEKFVELLRNKQT